MQQEDLVFLPDAALIADKYKATISSMLGGDTNRDWRKYHAAEQIIIMDILSTVRVDLNICTPDNSYALDLGAGVGRLSKLLVKWFNFVHLVEKNYKLL